MKYSLVMLALFAGMGACSTDEIEVYKTGRYVYFTDMPTDSIKESFFFYPDAETIDVDLYVRYAGREVESDINYQLVVDEELTTAQAGIVCQRLEIPFGSVFQRSTMSRHMWQVPFI